MEPTTNTGKHAKAEMEALAKHTPDHVLKGMEEEIVALADAFGRSGQSDAMSSANYVSEVISRMIRALCMHEPVSPLSGDDSEWEKVAEDDEGPILQNKRCGTLFKKSGIATYIDAITFVDQNGAGSGGTVEGVSSIQKVKSFPFKPKTFLINVILEPVLIEVPGDKNYFKGQDGKKYRHKIKDWDDLIPVFEYYDQLEVK